MSFFDDETLLDEVKDPKTGKTISVKKAWVVTTLASAASATIAGGIIYALSPDEVTVVKSTDTDTTGGGILAFAREQNEAPESVTQLADDSANEDLVVLDDDSVSIANDSNISNNDVTVFNPFTAPVAHGIHDQMSFAEAFATARQETGAGGVFTWRGQLYGTFYATEVNEDGYPVIDYPVVDASTGISTVTQTATYAFDPSKAPLAFGVSDEMSFSDAFASARQEVGAGGVFSWRGQLYGTFYATEVNGQGEPIIPPNPNYAVDNHILIDDEDVFITEVHEVDALEVQTIEESGNYPPHPNYDGEHITESFDNDVSSEGFDDLGDDLGMCM